MSWLAWIIFGLIAGFVAKSIHPGNDPGGWIVTILIGIAGALLGGWLGSMLLGWDVTGFNFQSLILAIIGSVLLLWLYRMFTTRR